MPRTLAESRLKKVFPILILPGQFDPPEASRRGKVPFLKEPRLTVADATVLDKLEKMQIQHYTAMIPYESWPARVLLGLSGDVSSLSRWAVANQLSWPFFVEAIIQILGQNNALHAQVTHFSTLLPFKYEAYVNFA